MMTVTMMMMIIECNTKEYVEHLSLDHSGLNTVQIQMMEWCHK